MFRKFKLADDRQLANHKYSFMMPSPLNAVINTRGYSGVGYLTPGYDLIL